MPYFLKKSLILFVAVVLFLNFAGCNSMTGIKSSDSHSFTDPETGVKYSTFLDLGSVEVKATFEAHGKCYLVIDRLYDSETGLFPDGTDGIYTLKCSKEHYDAVSAGDLLSGTKEYIVDTKEGFLTDINWNSKGYFLSSQEP